MKEGTGRMWEELAALKVGASDNSDIHIQAFSSIAKDLLPKAIKGELTAEEQERWDKGFSSFVKGIAETYDKYSKSNSYGKDINNVSLDDFQYLKSLMKSSKDTPKQ